MTQVEMWKTKVIPRQPLWAYGLSAETQLWPQNVCWINDQKTPGCGSGRGQCFQRQAVADNKLECLSNTLCSMSRSTLFNSFMFYKVSHPAADQMQINTEDKSIIFSDTAAGTLLTNSHTFYPSEISQMVSFLGQLWRLPPGLLEHHSSPAPGSHFVLKLYKWKRQQP